MTTAFNSINDIEEVEYDGLYLATVFANNDPKQLQRIQVTIPNLLQGNASTLPWIGKKAPAPFGMSGTAGVIEVPVVGSKIMVYFQEGKLYYGLYDGCVPNTDCP